jgi:hypothetical protein
VLGQAVQANLVERVCQWPGVHSAGALINGTPLEGHWFDHTQEFAARLRREDISRLRFAAVETVTMTPIPCWAHLSPELYRERIATLVESIETDGGGCQEVLPDSKKSLAPVLGVLGELRRSFSSRLHPSGWGVSIPRPFPPKGEAYEIVPLVDIRRSASDRVPGERDTAAGS